MSTIIDITNNSPRQTSTSTSSTSRRSPILTTTTHHHDTHSDTESDSDADWATRYGKRSVDTDTDADGVKSSDKHDVATKPLTTTTDSDDEHEAKHELISKVDIVHPVTAPLLHKTSALSFPDDNSVKRQPSSVGVLQPVPQQSIYQRSNSLLSCILLFLVIFQLMIGIMGLLLTISSWNVHCDYPLQFLSLAISVVFLAFGCVLAAYMCLVTAEQATKAFATLFCLLYFAGVPLFWVGLYWLHRSSSCDANLTEQLYQLYSPLFMVPWLVMLSSIVVIPVMLYYGCRSCTSKMKDEKSDVV